jgi:hypothetical protein
MLESMRCTIAALRELCMVINADCQKGAHCNYGKRARHWQRL